jgi:hypothetical protein
MGNEGLSSVRLKIASLLSSSSPFPFTPVITDAASADAASFPAVVIKGTLAPSHEWDLM